MSPRLVMIAEKPRISCTKYIERRIVRAWKSVTRMGRQPHRTSIMIEDFVILTAKRRSIMFAASK
ncbi:hypothetical protein EIP86_007531 [Pleurotus ostreatoroseus]|nr:hypothetical protein EIP86_007531 [Pleurotus ostreatoroseus]